MEEKWKKDNKRERLSTSKVWRRKGFTLVMEELKQRITAKATKIKRYENTMKQFKNNRNLQNETLE